MKNIVDWRSSFSLVGSVIKWLSVPLLFPLLFALHEQKDILVFVYTIIIAWGAGFLLERLETEPRITTRSAFLVVGLTWLLVPLFGALPYLFAGNGSLAHLVNAYFESMSGFTTTGATVMKNISFDIHSSAIIIWRQISQWLGGMGIVVLAVAILPKLSLGGTQLMEAETPGPGVERLAPRIVETARRLWALYAGLTGLEILLLYASHLHGYAPKMTFYQSFAHGLTTMPTGGFSPMAASIAAFSSTVQWIIIVFMFLAGTNFAFMWRVLVGKINPLRDDKEFLGYLRFTLYFTLILTFVLPMQNIYTNFFDSLRHGAFQVISLITTTGFASADFNYWGALPITILFLAMFVGGSAGSTGGGIKIIRWLVALKTIGRELFTTLHPRSVRPLRLGKKIINERVVRQVISLILTYFLVFLGASGAVAIFEAAGNLQVGVIDILSTTAACLGNIGPAFGIAGPMNNYLAFSIPSQITFIILMWVGRLEIFTVLIIFLPSYWKN
ncbi:MAG: TrkH family potassium uptake protein [bacterium]